VVFGFVVDDQILVILVKPLPISKSTPQDVDLLSRMCLGFLFFCCEGLGPPAGGLGASNLRQSAVEKELGDILVFLDQDWKTIHKFGGRDVQTSGDMATLRKTIGRVRKQSGPCKAKIDAFSPLLLTSVCQYRRKREGS